VVLIVSFEVPEPFITEAGLNEQVGGAVVVADPINTILLHEKVTPWLNPSVGVIVIVELADPPAGTEVGDTADAEIWKPGAVVFTRRSKPSEPKGKPSDSGNIAKSGRPSPVKSVIAVTAAPPGLKIDHVMIVIGLPNVPSPLPR
jgi:hypothetical protein